MTDQVEKLILEHLKAIRAGIAQIDGRLDDLAARVASIERHVADLLADVLRMNGRFDRLESRMLRIERRLELVD